MKKYRWLTSICILGSLAFCACEKENPVNEHKGETAELWWNSNTLATLELRGKVRSVNQRIDKENSMYMEFDVNGNIVQLLERSENGEEQIVYEYDTENQLITECGNKKRTDFSYGQTEKYVPQNPKHWTEFNLIQSLEKVSYSSGESWLFIEEGDVLFAVNEQDTVAIQYDGKLPISCTYSSEGSTYFVGPVTYYPNGMYKEYVEGVELQGRRVQTVEQSYYANNAWLQLQQSKGEDGTIHYAYNTSNHLETVTIQSEIPIVSSYQYDYDSKGNWTISTMSLQYADYPEIKTITTREITYY